MSETKCLICDNQLRARWTDAHGVAVCSTCNAPYRLWHYDEDGQRVEKEPALCVDDDTVQWVRDYWLICQKCEALVDVFGFVIEWSNGTRRLDDERKRIRNQIAEMNREIKNAKQRLKRITDRLNAAESAEMRSMVRQRQQERKAGQ